MRDMAHHGTATRNTSHPASTSRRALRSGKLRPPEPGAGARGGGVGRTAARTGAVVGPDVGPVVALVDDPAEGVARGMVGRRRVASAAAPGVRGSGLVSSAPEAPDRLEP